MPSVLNIQRTEPVVELNYLGYLLPSRKPQGSEQQALVPRIPPVPAKPSLPARVEPVASGLLTDGSSPDVAGDRSRINDSIRRQIDWQGKPDPWALRDAYDLLLEEKKISTENAQQAKSAEPEGGLLRRLLRLMIETYDKLFSPPVGQMVDLRA